MKRLLVFFLFLTFLQIGFAQDHPFFDAFVQKWDNSKTYTLECLALMPSEKYNYKPTEDEMDFQKLSIHIINNMIWLSGDYLDAPKFENDLKTINPDKAQLEKIMAEAYDHAMTAVKNTPPHNLNLKVDFFAGEKNIRQIIELMDDHATHHRAQLAVYLRMNGIKPPKYRGW